ncbi:2-dehydropantoate 2-reductase [soil metagenome]
MRILVIGAGAIGGYFGGRLLQAGRDVSFLVRPRRAGQLAESGLVIESPHGNLTLPNPPVVLAENLREPFDLILLSCKAYDLAGAIESFAPAVGPQTLILPLLNGMQHLDALDARFGAERVLGGKCVISATLDDDGVVKHLNPVQSLSYGSRTPRDPRMPAVQEALANAGFDALPSEQIVQEMWEKWIFLTTLAGATCLMRAAIGAIMAAPGGERLVLRLLDECSAIAAGHGHAPRAPFLAQIRPMLTAAGSPTTASMLRDIERNARIEADHIVGDLLRRRPVDVAESASLSVLDTAYTHLKAYEARRG